MECKFSLDLQDYAYSFYIDCETSSYKLLYQAFLAPLAVGQRAYVMVRCPSCVRPSVLTSPTLWG